MKHFQPNVEHQKCYESPLKSASESSCAPCAIAPPRAHRRRRQRRLPWATRDSLPRDGGSLNVIPREVEIVMEPAVAVDHGRDVRNVSAVLHTGCIAGRRRQQRQRRRGRPMCVRPITICVLHPLLHLAHPRLHLLDSVMAPRLRSCLAEVDVDGRVERRVPTPLASMYVRMGARYGGERMYYRRRLWIPTRARRRDHRGCRGNVELEVCGILVRVISPEVRESPLRGLVHLYEPQLHQRACNREG